MNLNSRERKLLILAVIIIGGGSLLKWVILPGVDAYQNLQAQLQTAEHNWQRKQMLLDRSQKYKQQLATKQGKLQAVKKLLFGGNLNQARLRALNILEEQIKSSGLQVNNKSIEVTEKKEQNYRLINYNLTLFGRYNQLIKFLQGIRQKKKHFITNKLRINGERNRRNVKLRINISLTIINSKGGASSE